MIRRRIKDFKMSYGEYKDIPVTLPCSVYSAMKTEGYIPDPYKGMNAERILPTMSEDATFVACFDVDPSAISRRYAYLRMSGIDTVAEVYLGDRLLGRTDSPSRTYTYDVSGLLTPGENRLTVRCLASGLTAFGKAAYTLGSDYSAPMPDMGILGDVELMTFDNAVITGMTLTQRHDAGAVTLGIKLNMLGSTDGIRAVATLVSPAGQIYYGGITRGYGTVSVRDPLYWWPHGLGVQNLYKLTVNLYGDSDIEDTCEARVGLRTVVVDKAEGSTRVKVNGVSVLPMGALYTPETSILSHRTGRKTESIVSSAAAAGFNSLIVSGEGAYPTSELLDFCDAYGILLLQEIVMGADGSTASRESVIAGLSDSLSRAATHPSLAAVIETDKTELSDAIYAAVRSSAPDIAYVQAECNVWSKDLPSSVAYPSPRTLPAFGEGKELNPYSRLIEWQTAGASRKMTEAIFDRYLWPASKDAMMYATQLVQADVARERVEAARLSAGRELSAFYSRLVDCRPAVSDGGLDYFCRRRALHYRAAAFFSPLCVITANDGGRVTFSVSNERKNDFFGVLCYRVLDRKNVLVAEGREEVNVPRGSTLKAFVADLSDTVEGHEEEYYLEYSLKDGDIIQYKGTALFTLPKYFDFADPGIRAIVSGVDRRFSVTLTSLAYARSVYLDFDGIDAVFEDNFFDITSPAPVKVQFHVVGGAVSAEHLAASLTIRSVYDIHNG